MREEGGFAGGEGASGATDVATLREEAKTLMASDAWKNFQNKDHNATRAKVDDIYSKIAAAGKK